MLLSSKKPIAWELRGKAIARAQPVLPMPKPVSGFRDGLAFPGLLETDLSLTKFLGEMEFERASIQSVSPGSRQILGRWD